MPQQHDAPAREHWAQPRGFIRIGCPIGRCDYAHRFPETDLTAGDAQAHERRLQFLRTHHSAGHPQRPTNVVDQRKATIYNVLARDLREFNMPTRLRQEVAQHILEALDRLAAQSHE